MDFTIMIKPASGLCNLRCRYCFYRDEAENRETASYGMMTGEVRAQVLSRAFEALPKGRNRLTLVFQGGEPMLAGKAFFEGLEADIQRLRPAGTIVDRCIQTNGTLIDDDWAAFFAKYDYLIGISLDGPAAIQNDLRPDAAGKGSFSRVTAGVQALKKRGVNVNILTVVTAEVARHGRKVYSFLRKNGWERLQFIPCMDFLDGKTRDFSLTPELYGRFLADTFDLYEEEKLRGGRVSVRWFDNLIAMAAGGMPESCGMTGVCACQFVVEADGSGYPCDFYVDDARRLGNLAETGFREMFESETARKFIAESRFVPERCEKCRWRALCRNGCRRYRGESGLNRLCGAYEYFFERCGARILRLAQYYR